MMGFRFLKGQTLCFFQREVAFKQSKMTTVKAKQILPLNLSRKGSFSFDNKLGKTTSKWGYQEGRGVGERKNETYTSQMKPHFFFLVESVVCMYTECRKYIHIYKPPFWFSI